MNAEEAATSARAMRDAILTTFPPTEEGIRARAIVVMVAFMREDGASGYIEPVALTLGSDDLHLHTTELAKRFAEEWRTEWFL